MTLRRMADPTSSSSWTMPMRMLSRNDSLNSRGVCGVYALRGGVKNAAGSSTTAPFHRISPSSFGSKPRTARSSVVFPDPMRPVTTVKLPLFTAKVMSATPCVESGCWYERPVTSRWLRASPAVATAAGTVGKSPRRCTGPCSTSVSGGLVGVRSTMRSNETRARLCWAMSRAMEKMGYVACVTYVTNREKSPTENSSDRIFVAANSNTTPVPRCTMFHPTDRSSSLKNWSFRAALRRTSLMSRNRPMMDPSAPAALMASVVRNISPMKSLTLPAAARLARRYSWIRRRAMLIRKMSSGNGRNNTTVMAG